MKILLTEDEIKFGSSIKQQLEQDGYIVDWVQDGNSSKSSILNFEYDIVIMDINLPKKDGISVIRELRDLGCHTPILILTANSRITDCVKGLDSGADDYLIKPFNYEEIKSRLNAIVRRERRTFHPALKHRELILDTKKHVLTINGKRVKLTRREYALLALLMSDPNKAFSSHRLLEAIYDFDNFAQSNVINAHIYNLRKKLGEDYIETIRGFGFKMG